MTGLVNFLFTFVALFTVDRLGRKPLMLFGAAGLTLIYTALGYCYHLKSGGGGVPNTLFLALVLAAIATYSMSLAPVTWVIISNLPQPYSGLRHVHRGRLPLDCLFPAHVHLSHLQRRPRPLRDLLDLCGHLLRWIRRHPGPAARDQRQDTSSRSRRI